MCDPACHEAVAMVEAYEPTKVIMRCPACGHIWRDRETEAMTKEYLTVRAVFRHAEFRHAELKRFGRHGAATC